MFLNVTKDDTNFLPLYEMMDIYIHLATSLVPCLLVMSKYVTQVEDTCHFFRGETES